MNYVADIAFWLSAAFSITGICVLVASIKLKCKGWLLGFLILSLLSSAGFYVPNLLRRNDVMTMETYRKIIEPMGVVFQVLRISGLALLLGFIFSLKSVGESAAAGVSSGAGAGGSPPPPLPDSPYKGYGGWLALFGAVQLFVQPILAVIMLVVGAAAIGEASSQYPSFIVIYFLEALGSIIVVGLGMRAAIKLRSIRPGAVRAAKLYLFVALAWSVLSFALPYMGDIPDRAREAMTIENVKGFLKTIIPFAIWFSYFNVSKRVKATYID